MGWVGLVGGIGLGRVLKWDGQSLWVGLDRVLR